MLFRSKKSEDVTGKVGKKGAGKSKGKKVPPAKPDALFSYTPTTNNALMVQLMKEAREVNCKRFPACGTFLLRNIVEGVLKHIIDSQKANSAGKMLDLEGAINLCCSTFVHLHGDDKKVLKEFSKSHLAYLNLGSHASVIPNADRLASARDCIDQFIKKYV